MVQINGVLFDKDGTLIDFQAIWLPVMEAVCDTIVGRLVDGRVVSKEGNESVRRKLMGIYGVDPDTREIDPEGNLAASTVERSAAELARLLTEKGWSKSRNEEQLIQEIATIMNNTGRSEKSRVKPTTDLHRMFRELASRNIFLGVATADSRQSTEDILSELEVFHYFDFIGSGDDDRPDKPDPAVVYDFCSQLGLRPEETAFVGDTPTDLRTGKNAGVSLVAGVLCGVGNREMLSGLADILLKDPGEVIRVIDLLSGAENLFAGRPNDWYTND